MQGSSSIFNAQILTYSIIIKEKQRWFFFSRKEFRKFYEKQGGLVWACVSYTLDKLRWALPLTGSTWNNEHAVISVNQNCEWSFPVWLYSSVSRTDMKMSPGKHWECNTAEQCLTCGKLTQTQKPSSARHHG